MVKTQVSSFHRRYTWRWMDLRYMLLSYTFLSRDVTQVNNTCHFALRYRRFHTIFVALPSDCQNRDANIFVAFTPWCINKKYQSICEHSRVYAKLTKPNRRFRGYNFKLTCRTIEITLPFSEAVKKEYAISSYSYTIFAVLQTVLLYQ